MLIWLTDGTTVVVQSLGTNPIAVLRREHTPTHDALGGGEASSPAFLRDLDVGLELGNTLAQLPAFVGQQLVGGRHRRPAR
mgnify:CR=1 FL=1